MDKLIDQHIANERVALSALTKNQQQQWNDLLARLLAGQSAIAPDGA